MRVLLEEENKEIPLISLFEAVFPVSVLLEEYIKEIPSLVQPLDEIELGTYVKIVYILPSLKSRLDRLTNLGIIPGNIILPPSGRI